MSAALWNLIESMQYVIWGVMIAYTVFYALMVVIIGGKNDATKMTGARGAFSSQMLGNLAQGDPGFN